MLTLRQVVGAPGAIVRHEARRRAAYAATTSAFETFPDFPKLKFGPVAAEALAAWRAHWLHSEAREVAWPWPTIKRQYRARYDRFEVAIWAGEELCALSLGRFSPARTILQVNWIEGSPDAAHPLRGRVVWTIVQFAKVLGEAYEAERLRITEPSPRVRAILLGLKEEAFTFVAASSPMAYDYCEMRLP